MHIGAEDTDAGSFFWELPEAVVKALSHLPEDTRETLLEMYQSGVEQYLGTLLLSAVSSDPIAVTSTIRDELEKILQKLAEDELNRFTSRC